MFALYWVEFYDILDWSPYRNLENEQNIVFFYITMIKNEDLVVNFIRQNKKYLQLIKDILIEREISDKELITEIVSRLIDKCNTENVMQLITLGYFAKNYNYITTKIQKALINRYITESDIVKRSNLIIGLMSFCEEHILTSYFKSQLDYIDIDIIVRFAGESLDKYATIIFKFLIKDEKKNNFIEQLAKSYRFNALYNIYLKSSERDYKYSVFGLLYMSREIDLFRWLENLNFSSSVDDKTIDESKALESKYGWLENEMNEAEKLNLYILLVLCKRSYQRNQVIIKKLIHNRVAFLLSYIFAVERNNEDVNFINIKNLKIRAVCEYENHWKRHLNKKKKMFSLFGTGVRITTMNNILISIVILMIFRAKRYMAI